MSVVDKQSFESILSRLLELCDAMDGHQYKDGDELPLPGTAIGAYKSITSFVASLRKQVPNDSDDVKLLAQYETIGDVQVTSGASMMAMWFMSQTYAILKELEQSLQAQENKDSDWDAILDQLQEVMDAILEQLKEARQLPYFYQGDGKTYDKFDIPIGIVPSNAMGWWPLVHYDYVTENNPSPNPNKKAGLGIPPWEITPEQAQTQPLFGILHQLLQKEEFGILVAALSDIDFWAWTMAVEDTTPGVLEFPDREDPTHSGLDTREHFVPLMPSDVEAQFTKNEKYFTPSSRELIKQIRKKNSDVWPIALYYGVDSAINQLQQSQEATPPGDLSEIVMHKQTVDGAIVCNVLSSAVLMYDKLLPHKCPSSGKELPDLRPEFEKAALFVREGLQMALLGDLPWNTLSYSYYDIQMSPLSYITRAHKRIVEVDRRRKAKGETGVPEFFIFDDCMIKQVAVHTINQGLLYLSENNPYTKDGALTYANLVYTFNTLANLRFIDPTLFDSEGSEYDKVYDRLLEALMLHNEDAERVIGTGPYFLFPDFDFEEFMKNGKFPDPKPTASGYQLSIEFPMASPCFIWPPLMEAYALHLVHSWNQK